jgi:hypothetical protein
LVNFTTFFAARRNVHGHFLRSIRASLDDTLEALYPGRRGAASVKSDVLALPESMERIAANEMGRVPSARRFSRYLRSVS